MRGRAGGVAWVVCPPPWWCCVQGACASTLLLFLAPKKWQLGVWSFCILLFIICPNYTCAQLFEQLFLVPYGFFVLCRWRRCLSRCKHCSKGSRSQPVSLPGDKIGGVLRAHIMWRLRSGVILSHLGITLIMAKRCFS